MGNIIGESFKDYVRDQVKIRQQKIGQLQKDNSILTYENSKTSWLRLTSGINVTEEKCKELGLDPELFKNELLAKNYILFNSVSSISDNNSPKLKGGINSSYDNSILSSKAYGFNSGPNYGLVPPPGILSATITPKNRGSLRIAEIRVKCFSRQQFTIIETLFLRLKYSILLEWGHSLYFNNDGNLVTNPTNTIHIDFLNSSPPLPDPAFVALIPDATSAEDKSNQKQKIILDRIEQGRKNHAGNYDGFLGWVTNFSWTLQASNEYDITIKAVSYGDIIESLSITSPIFQDSDGADDAKKNTSSFGRALESFKVYLDNGEGGEIGKVKAKNFKGYSNLTHTQIKNIIKTTPAVSYEDDSITFYREIVKVDASWYQEGSDAYFMKLGFLLKLIQNFFYKYDTSTSKNYPINFFNYDPQNTFCSITPSLFSADPRICLIPSLIAELNELGDNLLGNGFLLKNKETNLMVGNTLNIHLNIDMILDVLNNNTDEEGNLSILDFIKTILSNVNKALLGITSLDLIYDEPSNTYNIIDNNLINSIELGSDENPAQINVGILQPNNGSFVLDASIQSEISNKLSTQLAIGAQANNSEIGLDSVAISRWNNGLIDRIVTNKSNSSFNINDSGSLDPQANFPYDKFKGLLDYYIDFTINEEQLNELSSLARDYIITERSYLVSKKQLSSNFFLPISLNLVLDGISGPTIFQKYTINDVILPRNYKDNIEFIIKGISHEINEGGWITNFESLSVPKVKKLEPVTPQFSVASTTRLNWIQNLQTFEGNDSNPWSAAFISYVVSQVDPTFPKSTGHALYANAIRNNKNSLWQVFNPATTPLKEGDIVIYNRGSVVNTFTSKEWKGPTHGDIIVKTTTHGFAEAVGGNLSDSVKKPQFTTKDLTLDTTKTGHFVLLRCSKPDAGRQIAKLANDEWIAWGGLSAQNLNLPEKLARKLYNYYKAGGFAVPIDATPFPEQNSQPTGTERNVAGRLA
jgi:hypothetical protein